MKGNLFSSYFLEEGIKNISDWESCDSETLNTIYNELNKIYSKFKKINNPDEPDTEDKLIRPFLEKLGFFYSRQKSPSIRQDIPDFVLFPDENSQNEFNKNKNLWNKAIAILEAKRWNKKLDRPDTHDSLDPHIPSNQILRYLSVVEPHSNGKILWGILTNGKFWRLYYHKAPLRSEGFIEFNLDDIFILDQPSLFEQPDSFKNFDYFYKFKLFYLIFRKDAFIPTSFRPNKTFLDLALEEGKRWEERITETLKEKIFFEIFPDIAKGFLSELKNKIQNIDENVLTQIYDNTLILLYRLLFILYAEDRNLLPITNEAYKNYSFTKIRDEVANKIDKEEVLSETSSLFWDKIKNLFKIINIGDRNLGIPPYNGGLFNENKHPFLNKYSVPDKFIVPAIDKLSRDYTFFPYKRINYRDLSVRQLGSIYEGLLEFKLKIAQTHLEVKKEKSREIYIPTNNPQKATIKKGEIYLTNDKSERKATGSYYTPDYIVQYIGENTISSLISEKINIFKEKIKQIKNKKEISNTEKTKELKKYDPAICILKIKILDPAMGSGHFLVDAVDYLADKILEIIIQTSGKTYFGKEEYSSPLLDDLKEIRKQILYKAEKENYFIDENRLEDKNLIKRIILKRCIYGIDLNPLAVELAKVSLWLHTFTVGAPLSFLDHHLKCGNSLIGANLEDFRKVFETIPLFSSKYAELIKDAVKKIEKIQEMTDADISEVEESAKIYRKVMEQVEPYKKLLDVYTADFFLKPKKKSELKKYYSPLMLLDGTKGDPLDVINKKTKLSEDENSILSKAKRLAQEKRFFHWKLEFPEVWYEAGKEKADSGFDVVIGNPPYVRQEQIKDIKQALSEIYKECYDSIADLYVYFYYKGIEVLKENGYFSMITSNKFLRARYGEKLRDFLSKNTSIIKIIDFVGFKVFKDASVDTLVIVLKKGKENKYVEAIKYEKEKDYKEILNKKPKFISQKYFTSKTWLLEDETVFKIKEKIEKIGIPLKDWDVKIYRGVLTGFNEAFIIDEKKRQEILARCKTQEERKRTEKIIKPVLRGRDIKRYYYEWAGLYVILVPAGWTNAHKGDIDPETFFRGLYPAIYEHLREIGDSSRPNPNARKKGLYHRDDMGDYWWELRHCDYYHEFEKEKIVWQEMTNKSTFSLVKGGIYFLQTAYMLTTNNKYLLSILNSKLVNFYLEIIASTLGSKAKRWIKQYVEQLPIPKIPEEKQKPLIELVDKMIEYNHKKHLLELFIKNKLKSGSLEMIQVIKLFQTHREWEDNASLILQKQIAENLKNKYANEIKNTDKLIDQIVYHLYGLKKEEIKIIEQFFNKN